MTNGTVALVFAALILLVVLALLIARSFYTPL